METLSCRIPVNLNINKNGNHTAKIIHANPNHYVRIRTFFVGYFGEVVMSLSCYFRRKFNSLKIYREMYEHDPAYVRSRLFIKAFKIIFSNSKSY